MKLVANSLPKNKKLPFQLKLDNSLLDVGGQNHQNSYFNRMLNHRHTSCAILHIM